MTSENLLTKTIFGKIKVWHVILAIILLWGAFLRLYNIGVQSLWIDESFSAIAIKNAAEKGVPLLDSGVMYARGKPHTYFSAAFYLIFGPQEWALRLPAALFGILMIWLIYFTGKRFFKNRIIGLIAAGITAFGYFEIAWSRQIRMYSMLQFFFLLSIVLFYIFLDLMRLENPSKKQKKWRWILFALILPSFVVTIMVHKLGFFLFPTYFVMSLFYFKWSDLKKIEKKKQKLIVFLCGLVGLLIAIHFFIFPLPSIFKMIFNEFSSRSAYLDHYLKFLAEKYRMVSIGAIIGVICMIYREDRKVLMLTAIFAMIFLWISLNREMGMRYFFFIVPFLFLLASYAIYYLCRPGRIFYARLLVAIVLFSMIFRNDNFVFLPKTIYFLESDSNYEKINTWDYTPQPNFKAAYEYIEKNRSEDDIFIVTNTAIHDWYMPHSIYHWLSFPFFGHNKKNIRFAYKGGLKVDFYTGTHLILHSYAQMIDAMRRYQGYVIVDYFSLVGHLHPKYKRYMDNNLKLVFYDQAHPRMEWTRIWVYKF